MFDGTSNVHLGGENLKTNDPKISVMCRVEHTVSLLFNNVSKIPVVNQIITAYKAIYKLFGSGIYNKPHSIFKPKWYEFHNRNIDLFSGNDMSMAGYFIELHIYMNMRKEILSTVSSDKFNTMSLNSKTSKVV